MSKIQKEKKSLISTFQRFLTAIAKVYFLERGLGTGLEVLIVTVWGLRSWTRQFREGSWSGQNEEIQQN